MITMIGLFVLGTSAIGLISIKPKSIVSGFLYGVLVGIAATGMKLIIHGLSQFDQISVLF